MAEDLIIPVPRLMSAVYLVPVALSAQVAQARVAAGLDARLASPVGVAARMMLDAGTVTVTAVPSSSLPPFGVRLQEYPEVDPELVRVVSAAGEFVMIRAVSSPGWPPMHEWAGRACAAVVAAEAAVPLVDTATPQVLTADAALRTLPAAEDARFRLADCATRSPCSSARPGRRSCPGPTARSWPRWPGCCRRPPPPPAPDHLPAHPAALARRRGQAALGLPTPRPGRPRTTGIPGQGLGVLLTAVDCRFVLVRLISCPG